MMVFIISKSGGSAVIGVTFNCLIQGGVWQCNIKIKGLSLALIKYKLASSTRELAEVL